MKEALLIILGMILALGLCFKSSYFLEMHFEKFMDEMILCLGFASK